MDDIRIGRQGRVVRFLTEDGIRLKGILFRDTGSPGTCIVYVHGMGGGLVSSIPLSLARNMGPKAAIFSFGNRGEGLVSIFSRYTGKGRKSLRIGTNLERFEECVRDIRGAIGALGRYGYRSFVLCGHSTGCQKAAYYQYITSDRRVKGVVLISPVDDYNLNRIRLGRKFHSTKRICTKMIKSGRGGSLAPGELGFSAQRLDSVINTSRAEARIFDYEGRMDEFGSITVPVLAVFGEKEEHATKQVDMHLEILRSRSRSRRFMGAVVGGAGHSFDGYEAELARTVWEWAEEL